MPENYRFMMDYEYQTKKEETCKLKYIVSEVYILSTVLDFTKYFLSVNINSGVF
jgi:hypothetical protein